MVALVAAAILASSASTLKLELSASPWTATPEPLTVCASVAPLRGLEVDGCGGFAGASTALTLHAFIRRYLIENPAGFELAVGAGAGARTMRFCSSFGCAYSAGPEALLSTEGMYWFSGTVEADTVDAPSSNSLAPAKGTPPAKGTLGASLQLDAGIALQWLEAAPGVTRTAWRFPVRALLGIAYRF